MLIGNQFIGFGAISAASPISFLSFTLGSASTSTIGVTNNSGGNYALLVVANRGSAMAGSSATYNGVAMTQVSGGPWANAGNNTINYFYIANPASGTTNVVMSSVSGTYRGGVYLFKDAVGGAPTSIQANTSGGNPSAVTSDTQSIVMGAAVGADNDPGALSNAGATTDSNGALGAGGYSYGRTPGASSVSVTWPNAKSTAVAFSIK